MKEFTVYQHLMVRYTRNDPSTTCTRKLYFVFSALLQDVRVNKSASFAIVKAKTWVIRPYLENIHCIFKLFCILFVHLSLVKIIYSRQPCALQLANWLRWYFTFDQSLFLSYIWRIVLTLSLCRSVVSSFAEINTTCSQLFPIFHLSPHPALRSYKVGRKHIFPFPLEVISEVISNAFRAFLNTILPTCKSSVQHPTYVRLFTFILFVVLLKDFFFSVPRWYVSKVQVHHRHQQVLVDHAYVDLGLLTLMPWRGSVWWVIAISYQLDRIKHSLLKTFWECLQRVLDVKAVVTERLLL